MPRHPKWGRPIEEYFFQDTTNAFLSNEPTTEDCAPFSRALLLLQYPKELRTINNTNSLSNIISALRSSSYTSKADPHANTLFSYEYGFLVFRCIILFMQVGILAHTNSFGVFERKTRYLTDPHSVSLTLSELTMELMHESLKKPEPSDWFLGISESQDGSRMLLKSVGGFLDTDVDILLGALWDDRKRFLEIIARAPQLAAGWGLPLMLIAEHLALATNISGFDKRYDWGILQLVCFRYALTAPDHEIDMLAFTCLLAENSGYRMDPGDNPDNNQLYKLSLVDANDAKTFLVNYLKRAVDPTLKRWPVELAVQLVGYIRQDMILDITDWMPSLVEIVCVWTWKLIDWRSDKEPSHDINLITHASRTFDLIRRLFAAYTNAPSKTISSFLKPLVRQDFVGLCGKMVMLPFSMGSNISQVADEHPETFDRVIDFDKPYSVPYIWHRLARYVTGIGAAYCRYEPSSIFTGDYDGWLKLFRCFEADFPRHQSSTKSFITFKETSSAALTMLGSSLSFADRKERAKLFTVVPGVNPYTGILRRGYLIAKIARKQKK